MSRAEARPSAARPVVAGRRRAGIEWPLRALPWVDVAWVLFAGVNLAAIWLMPSWETVPFHFIWVSLTLVYGFRVWRLAPTAWVLVFVMGSTGTLIARDVIIGAQLPDELTEVPLMTAMFVVMVWHARRRLTALQEVEDLSAQHLELLERQREFVQDASHELRTPITVALGHAELVRAAALDPTTAGDARVVVEELMRLRRLADRLLLLAAAREPGFLHTTPIDLEDVVVAAVERWTPTPRRWVLGGLDDAVIEGDADRLELAIDALIENAVKHTEPGDTIELSVTTAPGTATVAVADTGPGIEARHLDRIFDRFARAEAGGGRTGTGGTGLGLAIVRTIAEAHRGSVSVRSERDRGSVFEITLPLAASLSGAPGAGFTGPREAEPAGTT